MNTQHLFLAATFIIILGVIFLSPDLSSALIIISLLSNFLVISTLLVGISEKSAGGDGAPNPAAIGVPWFPMRSGNGFAPDKDEFVASRPWDPPRQWAASPAPYPGGLEPDDLDYSAGADGDVPGAGAVYRQRGSPPRNGDAYPTAAPPKPLSRYDGSDSQPGTFDADRQNVEHARWRHDPYRVADGIMRRKELMSKHVAEELAEKEDEPWWGRHEN